MGKKLYQDAPNRELRQNGLISMQRFPDHRNVMDDYQTPLLSQPNDPVERRKRQLAEEAKQWYDLVNAALSNVKKKYMLYYHHCRKFFREKPVKKEELNIFLDKTFLARYDTAIKFINQNITLENVDQAEGLLRNNYIYNMSTIRDLLIELRNNKSHKFQWYLNEIYSCIPTDDYTSQLN